MTTPTDQELEQVAERVAEAVGADCPQCPNQGWYAVPNRKTGEPEQEQCHWCNQTPWSKFNVEVAVLSALKQVQPSQQFDENGCEIFDVPGCLSIEKSKDLVDSIAVSPQEQISATPQNVEPTSETSQDSSDRALQFAAEQMDWTQVLLNGGPPCFYLFGDLHFCGRAQAWPGHDEEHRFVSLADLIRSNKPRAIQLRATSKEKE